MQITRLRQLIMVTKILLGNRDSSLSSTSGAAAVTFTLKSLTETGRAKGRHNVLSLRLARLTANGLMVAEQFQW